MTLDKLFDTLINKFHIILGTVSQAAIIVYHFKTGRDIGPGVQGAQYAYLGFLLGHSGIYQKWPDKDSDSSVEKG